MRLLSCWKILLIPYKVCRMDILIVFTPSIVVLLYERLKRWSGNRLGSVRTGSHPVMGKNLIEEGQCHWWSKYFFRSCMRIKNTFNHGENMLHSSLAKKSMSFPKKNWFPAGDKIFSRCPINLSTFYSWPNNHRSNEVFLCVYSDLHHSWGHIT